MDFSRLFEPETMVVVGLSLTNERHPANVIFNKNFFRYPVKTYAVNPRGAPYHRERVYSRIADIPDRLDLAVIAVRAEYVAGVLEECVASGVGGVIVVSGGFAEVGNHALQDRISAIAREAGMPLIGPNCLGIYSPGCVDTFFLPSERMVRPEQGNVAVVSQSGGILVDQLVKFAGQGIGLSRAVGIGNKAAVGEIELIDYLARDDRTSVVALYLEGFGPGEGRAFVDAARSCRKPVIVMKGGKTAGGGRAVSSHTAAIAGDYEVFSSVMAQFGIVEATNEFEMVSFCEALSCYPRSVERGVGIISGSGGHAAVAVDACLNEGLEIPALTAEMQEALRGKLSSNIQRIASLGNPIDLTGSADDDDFITAASDLCRMSEIDTLIVLLLPYLPEVTSDVGARLSEVSRTARKPLVAYVPHVEKYRMIIEGFELNRIPVSHSIEGTVLMVEAMRRCRPC